MATITVLFFVCAQFKYVHNQCYFLCVHNLNMATITVLFFVCAQFKYVHNHSVIFLCVHNLNMSTITVLFFNVCA